MGNSLNNSKATSLEKMESALSVVADAIVWTDSETRVEWCNASFDCLTGRRHAEVLGATLSDILPLEQRGQRVSSEAHPVRLVLAGVQGCTGIYEFQRDGKRAILEISGAPARFDDNQLGAVLTVRDVTEQKENEERLISLNESLRRARVDLEREVVQRTAELSNSNADLRKQIAERERIEEEREHLLLREQKAREEAEAVNRLKDEFLATLSHELRTPLTPILGWVKLLSSQELDESTRAIAIQAIERNVKSEAKIIEDLLDVSRIVSGKLSLDVRPVELIPVIEAAIDTLNPAASAKNIQIRKQFDRDVGIVVCDPNRMQQVIWNLLSNAIKFTPSGGRVGILLERIESNARITVIDTGQGIQADFLPHVFERFRQADSSIKRNHGGLGLGLAIVRHVVELHGGTIRATSVGVGEGATFRVELPLTGGVASS